MSRPRGGKWRLVALAAVALWVLVKWGGSLKTAGLLQPKALAIVGGGTLVALLVSYPVALLSQAMRAVYRAWTDKPEAPDAMVSVFAEWASRAKRSGMRSVEREIGAASDSFVARALALVVSGADAGIVRQALDVDHRVAVEREEEYAQVLESAGGYAPTLGIIAAVLGLMRAMHDLSSPAQVGAGIASAFVATLYGLGAANLIFLPLSSRLRTHARQQALRREFTIDGVMALHAGLHPRLVEERLSGYRAAPVRDADVA